MRRWQGCTAPRCTGAVVAWLHPDGTNDAASASVSVSPPARATVFGSPLFDAGRGSEYYFPSSCPDGAARDKKLETQQRGACIINRSSGLTTTASHTAASDSVTWLRTRLRQVPVDTSRPPVSAEELFHWQLDRYIFADVQPVHFFPVAKEPLFLLPPQATVTSLGPAMDALDRVYRQKGLFTPSEMAEVFFAVVPSYFVESTHVFKALPSNVVFRLDSLLPRGQWVTVLLSRYPMLFDLRRPKFQRSTVKLNSKMWFVRAHPLYKAANRLMQAHNADFKAHGGGMLHRHVPTGSGADAQRGMTASVRDPSHPSQAEASTTRQERKPLDLQIFDILVRHLPRVPSPPSATDAPQHGKGEPQRDAGLPSVTAGERYAPMRLADWINSFPQDELDVLNLAPQDRVITILNRYTHVFQLLTHALPDKVGRGNSFMDSFPSLTLFIDRSELRTDEAATRSSEEDSAEAETAAHLQERQAGDGRPRASGADASATRPEKLMKEALRDDIVGLDDLIAAHVEGHEDHAFEQRDGSFSPDERLADPVPVSADCEEEDIDFENLAFEDRRAETLPDTENPQTPRLLPMEEDEVASSFSPRLPRAADRVESLHSDGASHEADGLLVALDALMVRRLPPDIAPRSLSNFNETTTPCLTLVRVAASFLNPPPSLAMARTHRAAAQARCRLAERAALFRGETWEKRGQSPEPDEMRQTDAKSPAPPQPSAKGLWRWVAISRIYKALTREQRHYVRREFKGLVNFLRLHGELFELNADFTHIIAHDPGGVVAPLVPCQTQFNFEERVVLPDSFDEDDSASAQLLGEETRLKFAGVLGNSQLPTTRQQLVLLDPNNPLLHHEVFEEEVAELVPATGPVSRTHVMRSLPPLLRAVVPTNFHLSSNRLLVCWTENGVAMVQRRELGQPAALAEPVLAAEEAIEALQASIPVGGATVRALVRMHLPNKAVRSLETHYGGVYAAVAAFPHYFRLTRSHTGGRSDALVELILT